MMEAAGLIPSDTGQPGGKRTGQKVSHYVESGGVFADAVRALLAEGFSIPWQAMTRDEAAAKKKAASKTRYTCPGCGLNAWGKSGIYLICGECGQRMEAAEPGG